LRLHTFTLLLLSPLASHAQSPLAQPPTPRVTLVSPALLAHVKQQQNPAILKAVRGEADAVLTAGPWSVMQKSALPVSGDKHDFLSLATYFWPNPDTPNHLPYIRKDGERNPELDSIPDHQGFFDVALDSHALALAWYLTGDERYARRASLLLHIWFLDPATRMNPNLNFAQGIRGVNYGRGIGVIDAHYLPQVCDAVALLAGSPAWTAADTAAISAWFQSYFTWLQTSPNGVDEASQKNNHGSWYDVQAASIALFLGHDDIARNIIEAAKTKRIALQIQPDGRQPLELARTKSFGYSSFNLNALSLLAELGTAVNVDLWHYTAPGGGSLRAAADYLLPFTTGSKKWTEQNINGMDTSEVRLPFLLATLRLGDPKYQAVAQRLGKPTAQILILESALPATSSTR
jgi:hypothetical protein